MLLTMQQAVSIVTVYLTELGFFLNHEKIEIKLYCIDDLTLTYPIKLKTYKSNILLHTNCSFQLAYDHELMAQLLMKFIV